ncbi:carboxypeptidase [Leishmania donovani]|uniref:carboxypeptidase Taq n=1 Tax=Leishmania donovani TaxID=5661 RepID=A0A504Y3C8_LEIDO|nr:Carboxypeptidase Taq (M32) metallopeptidase family protein [Leishmania donovani]CAJ1992254.1 carboxypeptidase [Leishmania donovani]VDZ48089.1 carboxypeptidase_putative/GeneDB:LmjF.13.0090/GeneDB:LmjF.14.0180/GeneDB:LmjF.33.2540/GeneDB:LmjF.36.6260 [Leishmania donovani]
MEAYKKLETIFTKVYRLDHFLGLGNWDMNTNMPPKGEESRGEAMAMLSELRFGFITAPEVKSLIESATKGSEELNAVQRANLREMRRAWKSATALPAEFVGRKMRLTTHAHSVWRDSRKANDFAKFLPVLRDLVALAREEGSYLAAGTSLSPYEALMNEYEPGITTQKLDEVYANVKSWLPQLLKDIVQKQSGESVIAFSQKFPQDKQEALCKEFMKIWHFDTDAGRLDVSPHPFTGMTKEDCRLTTNYIEDTFVQSLYGVIHESGHGKYEQNCGPREHITQPVCNARSLGLHESQSLFAEFQIGHATPFIDYLTTRLPEFFEAQPAFSQDNMRKSLQQVKPGYIRVDADEVCYPLHVILRYEIERDLMEGKMEVEDVPRAWNAKMQEYLGLSTEGRDDVGCLQDVHWSMGALGYFPTYSLGAMYAAQIMASIRKELGDDKVDECLRTGELGPLLEKQQQKIWDHGCLYETDDLMTRATGETLNPEYLRRHLEARYLNA